MSKDLQTNNKPIKDIESLIKGLDEKYKTIYSINRDLKNIEIIKNKSKKQREIIITDLELHINKLQHDKNLKGRDIGRIIKAKTILKQFKEMMLYGEKK